MNDNVPFGYPLSDYAEVIIVGCFAGAIKYINTTERFTWLKFAINVLTAGFTAIMAFWVLKWGNVNNGGLMAFCLGVAGLMGRDAWELFEVLAKNRLALILGMPNVKEPSTVGRQEVHGAPLEDISIDVSKGPAKSKEEAA